ncbi:helix-turn-helix transcriptional regulator [Sporolactobacillus sp. KGMB 08714]|uniref:helix-turn-helix transcriptional regulator n=1 Tax=Sporolactobacillus sp. KGMB 08714 TaxID=3064704 RepID=UPI002FBEA7FF
MGEESNKIERILFFYDKLMTGDIVSKSELAQHFDVHERTIRRDVQDIRYYLARFYIKRDIIYDPIAKGYKMVHAAPLHLGEIVALSKIVLDSHVLNNDESKDLFAIIESHFLQSKPQWLENFVNHELMNYQPGVKAFQIFSLLDTIIKGIYQKKKLQVIRVEGHKRIENKVCPVGLIYKDAAFYLAAVVDRDPHQQGEDKPIPIKLQRDLTIKMSPEHFNLASNSFDEEEFKKRCMTPMQDNPKT